MNKQYSILCQSAVSKATCKTAFVYLFIMCLMFLDIENKSLGPLWHYHVLLSLYVSSLNLFSDPTTVELQWLEHLGNHGIMFETGVVRANEY